MTRFFTGSSHLVDDDALGAGPDALTGDGSGNGPTMGYFIGSGNGASGSPNCGPWDYYLNGQTIGHGDGDYLYPYNH